jgi:hypothetical protein
MTNGQGWSLKAAIFYAPDLLMRDSGLFCTRTSLGHVVSGYLPDT